MRLNFACSLTCWENSRQRDRSASEATGWVRPARLSLTLADGDATAAGALRNRQEHITEYRDAVKVRLRDLPLSLGSSCCPQIRGIGDKLAKKARFLNSTLSPVADVSFLQIVEICRTGTPLAVSPLPPLTDDDLAGTHRKLKLVGEKDKVVELLSGVYGIGTIKAGEYYDLGCRSLEDIGKVPGASLTDAMELGVKYYGDLAKRIPREEVTELYRHGESVFVGGECGS